MKSWFGAEVQLGVIVLLVSLPIVGSLIYLVGYGIVEHPRSLVPFAIGYGLAALAVLVLPRLPAKIRRRVEQTYAILMAVALVGWCGWVIFHIWRDQGLVALFTMLAAIFCLNLLIRFAARRADRVDYHQR